MEKLGPGSTFIQAGGVRLHYNDIGSGPVVVCLHGGGPGASGWSNFAQNVPALSQRFRLLLVDMPQFGASEKVVIQEGRLSYVSRVLKALLDELRIDQRALHRQFDGRADRVQVRDRPPRACEPHGGDGQRQRDADRVHAAAHRGHQDDPRLLPW